MALPDLTSNKKFPRLSRELEALSNVGGEVAAAGALTLLWLNGWANADENVGDEVDVEVAAKWKGPKGTLVKALLDSGGPSQKGFLEPDPDKPGTYRIHDFWVHAPKWVKERAARNAAREAEGKTLSQVRAEAGRKGAAAKHSKRPASARAFATESKQTDGTCHANPGKLPPVQISTVQLRSEQSSTAAAAALHGALASAGTPPAAPQARDRWPLGEKLRQLVSQGLGGQQNGGKGLSPLDSAEERDRLESDLHAVSPEAAAAVCLEKVRRKGTGRINALSYFSGIVHDLAQPGRENGASPAIAAQALRTPATAEDFGNGGYVKVQ